MPDAPDGGARDAFGQMPVSVASVLQRLSPTKLFTSNLPILRHSYIPPPIKNIADIALRNELLPCRVKWGDLMKHARGTVSFAELFAAHKKNNTFPPPLVFFGEQHHEPLVLQAQLQALTALHESIKTQERETLNRQNHRLHLILEQFSIEDQHLLDAHSAGAMTDEQLIDSYEASSEEGFRLAHYLPLLMLAKELKVRVWGGFPPRSWARLVHRTGIEAAQAKENERTLQSGPNAIPRFDAWDSITRIGAAHKTYLASLMSPDKVPTFPESVTSEAVSDKLEGDIHESVVSSYPTAHLRQPVHVERKGFAPAQTLKDAFLAHVTAYVLRHGDLDDHRNIVLVVCGLGHCEYGFGAPERVVEYLRAHDVPPFIQDIQPLIIAAKSSDSGIWFGTEAPMSDADGYRGHSEHARHGSLQHWLSDPWSRQLADAVVLY